MIPGRYHKSEKLLVDLYIDNMLSLLNNFIKQPRECPIGLRSHPLNLIQLVLA
jgi:hypothetical protein